MLNKERDEKVIALCQELIRARSYSGEENQVAEALKKNFQEMGFDDVIIDGYGNIIGKIMGNRPGKKIVF